jgi:hypothetical protein
LQANEHTMRSTLIIFLFIACAACSENKTKSEINPSASLVGTWQLISETKIQKDDTTFTASAKDKRMIKIINDTHFAFLNHDLRKGPDSLKVFVAGGGTYTLKDNHYTEHLEYCNYREWENNNFDFIISVVNDTLTQQGTEKVEGLGVDRIIIEKYMKTKE